MKRWHLPTLAPSPRNRRAREPGADAPRVPSVGRKNPLVLFSYPECRVALIDLRGGEELGDHQVRERAVVQVIAGRVSIECSDEVVACEAGTLVTFDPGEHHAVRALADTRLLLLLAPWPATRQTEPEAAHTQHLPANATAEPIQSYDTTADRPARTKTGRRRSEVNAADDRRRVLVVVDRAIVDVASVPASVVLSERQADEVYVITPILTSPIAWLTNDDASAIAAAEKRLAATLKRMQAQGVEADGAIGDESPLRAIEDALVEFPADEIIIAVHGDHDRHWRERGLADEIRSRHTQPLTEVVVEADGSASTRP